MSRRLRRSVFASCLALLASAAPALAQAPMRKMGELELSVLGVSAMVEPTSPVVPKNTASAIRVIVRAGGRNLTVAEVARFVGAGFLVQAEIAGPGLRAALTLPALAEGEAFPPDALLLPLPPLLTAGDYSLNNVRIVAAGRTVLDVAAQVTVQVIDQVLVSSVKTRPLSLDEIREKGIVLDRDDYLGFEFTLGLRLESKPMNVTFPVVFDRQGVPVPQPLSPPAAPPRSGVPLPPLPTIVPVLLEGQLGDGPSAPRVKLELPSGQPIQIPSVLVIPGNVGYLKQFFSAQLFVANGAPAGAGLVVRDVTGTLKLPAGADREPGTDDDPLALPEITRDGQAIAQPLVMPVLGVGPDGQPGTADDAGAFRPGEQGEAEFLIRGEKEGFHTIDLDIGAQLDGLPVGPVHVTGKANGAVLVRNPYFDLTFTVPSVVRRGERFKLFAIVTNIGQAVANDVHLSLDAARMSGVSLAGEATQRIETLRPGDARSLAFSFESQRTGQVVASYLHFDTHAAGGGELKFTLGVGERGVPLSPDTLVLPAAVDALPDDVLEAAMRVLGQAWSVANAPSGTLPSGVTRPSRTLVTQKALALAEAGLRVTLGQDVHDAVRDVALDFYGGTPLDSGFDQLLRQTEAGASFARTLGMALADAVASRGAIGYEREVAQLVASGPDFLSFAIEGATPSQIRVALVDASGRRTEEGASGIEVPRSEIPGAVIVPTGPASRLGVLTSPSTSPYAIEIAGVAAGEFSLSLTLPRGDGTFVRGRLDDVAITAGQRLRLTADLARADSLVLEQDADGDSAYEVRQTIARETLMPEGPRLISATLIGPETLDGASPFGFQAALLFDRVVDAATAALKSNYRVPANAVQSARRQLSGRLVFATLAQPEGPYVPTEIAASGIADGRGVAGPAQTVSLDSRLEDAGAVVSGRIVSAEGTPVTGGYVTYANNPNWLTCDPYDPTAGGFASVPLGPDGRYEFRYVRQDPCGYSWAILTREPVTGALHSASGFVRAAGEQIVLDIALFGRGTVAGRVRDGMGQPVPGARVVAVSVSDPQVGGTAQSDGEGRYSIGDITVGPFTVTAASGAFVGSSAGRIDRAGTIATVDVTLNGGSVRASGLVKKLEGGVLSALPGLPVIYSVSSPGGGGVPVAVAVTGSDGRYAFEALPTGMFTIEAALNTRDRASVSGTAGGGDDRHDLDILIQVRTESFTTVRGFVRLPDGSPVGGVIVSVAGRGVLSRDDGSFEIPGITVAPNSPQTVEAHSRDGLRRAFAQFVANQAGDVVEGIGLTLSGLGSVEFVALSPSGQTLAGQEVALLAACENPCGCVAQKTGPGGHVRFDGLPVGAVRAQAILHGSGYTDVASVSTAIARDGDVGSAVLRFGGVGAITGLVIDPDGRPALGAEVALRSRAFRYDGVSQCGLVTDVSHRMRTGPDGRFRFAGVNVGPVSLTAQQPWLPTQVGAEGVLVANGQTLDFQLRLVSSISGELSGTVFLPDGATPAGAGVEVTANGALPDVVVSTGADGRYRFPSVFPEGAYTLTARDAVTGGVTREQIYLRAQQDVTHDLRLRGRGTVRVRVVDGADRPVTSAFVRLTETGFPYGLHEGALEAANQGVLSLLNVFEGPMSVEARDAFARGGRVSATLARPGDTLEVKVRLTTSGRVAGRFLQRDRLTPIPFGVVKVIAGDRAIGQTITQGVGDIGAFSFEYVPAGPVRLEGQDPLTGRTAAAVGSIDREGQLLDLDLIAQGLGVVQGLVTRNDLAERSAHVDVVSGSFHASTFADGDGRYLVQGVPEGRVVVTAGLEGGLFSGTASGLLADGQRLSLDVALRGSGVVTGSVLRADGQTPGPVSLVSIQSGGLGGGTQSTTSDADGSFRFERVPAGPAALSATTLEGIDRGWAAVEVPSAGSVALPVRLNGVGRVEVTVRDAAGSLVPGAQVNVSAAVDPYFVFPGRTAENGVAVLPEVWAGRFQASAVDPSRGLAGEAGGTLLDRANARVEVRLEGSGRVGGTVRRHDGTPGPGVQVSLSRDDFTPGTTTVSRADGSYAFGSVHLGAFVLHARDTANGDFASGGGRLLFDGDAVVVDFQLHGIGHLRVQVRDSAGAPVPDARIDVSGSFSGRTGPDGSVTIFNVPSGAVTVSASAGLLGGHAAAVVSPDVQTDLTVTLDPVGTLRGRILQPGGVEGVAGAVVSVGGHSAVSATGGAYEVTLLPLQDFLQAVSVSFDGRLRAVGSVSLTLGAPVREQDFVLVGVGTVTGTVTGTDGAPTPGLRVVLSSEAGPFGGAFEGTTLPDGLYAIAEVPIGRFRVTVSDEPGAQATAVDSIGAHGQTVRVDLPLRASAVYLPFALGDWNQFAWHIAEDGAELTGYGGSSFGKAPHLALVSEGQRLDFAGSGNIAATEEDRREVVVRQDGLGGLSVTRKVYVPDQGYFARCLDVIENPGPEPVTVDLIEELSLRGAYGTEHVLETSSGHPAPSSDDQWLVLDDENTGDFYTGGRAGGGGEAPLAVVLAGVRGRAPDVVEWSESAEVPLLAYRWNGVVVPPGAKVSLLQLLSPQTDPDRARTSAVRLLALPPEALAGLSAAESQSVLNFDVPETSALAPLPPNDGVVRARVLGSDGESLMTLPRIRLRSRSPYYGRQIEEYRREGDTFVVRGVPREAYDVSATTAEAISRAAVTASVAGSFPVSGIVDLTTMPGRTFGFSSRRSSFPPPPEYAVDDDTSTVWQWEAGDSAGPPYYREPYFEVGFPSEVTVRQIRFRGASGWTPDPSPSRVRLEVLDQAASVVWSTLVDLPPALRDADVEVPAVSGARSVRLVDVGDETDSPGFADLAVLGEGVTVSSGRSQVDVVFRGWGALEGRALRSDGSGLGQASVELTDGPNSAYVRADSTGAYRFEVVTAEGSYRLIAHLPADWDFTAVADGVSVAADQKTTRDLTFAALGGVRGMLRRATGVSAWARVTLEDDRIRLRAISPEGYDVVPGSYLISDAPPGAYTLRVKDGTYGTGVVTRGVVISAGAVATEDVTLPPIANVRVTVTSQGLPVEGSLLRWQSDAHGPEWVDAFATDLLGHGVVYSVAGPPFRIRAYYPGSTVLYRQAEGTLAEEGEEAAVSLDLPPAETVSGTVAGTIRQPDGQPAVGAVVELRLEDGRLLVQVATDAVGRYRYSLVPIGSVRVLAQDPVRGGSPVEARGVVAAGATAVVDATLAGAIRFAGEREPWQVTLPAGVRVRLDLIGTGAGSLGPLADPFLEVYDPSGGLVASDDNGAGWSNNARLFLDTAVAGPYAVVARAAGEQIGAYVIVGVWYQGGTGFVPVAPYPGVVAGLVTRSADGAPVAGRRVRVISSAGGRNANAFTDSSGRYAIANVPPGPFRAELLDAVGAVVVQAEESMPDPGHEVAQDLQLPSQALGNIQGVALDEGVGLSYALVRLLDASYVIVGEVIADASGAFRFDEVPAGSYRVAAARSGENRAGRASITVTAGATVTVAVSLVPVSQTGTVIVTGVRSDGQPAPGEVVSVFVEGYGTIAMRALDEAGRAVFFQVPTGHVAVTANIGWEDGIVPAGGSLDVTVRIGEQDWSPINLTGTDGRPYVVFGDGSVTGGTVDCVPFCGPYARVQDLPFAWRATGMLLQAGREVATGPRVMSGLEVTRRAFVPLGGRFVRLLEIVRNPTAAPITVKYEMDDSLRSRGAPWSISRTSDGNRAFTVGDRYAIAGSTDDAMPELAFVVGDWASAMPVDALEWYDESDRPAQLRLRWQPLTIPPGETVILVHFIAQLPHGQPAEADSLAGALAGLTDHEALAGISDFERAHIVNFRVPGTVPAFGATRGRLSGTVREGGLPVAHAQVQLIDDAGTVLREGFTDEAGRFAFVVVPGRFHMVAFLPDGNRPTVQVATIAAGEETSATLTVPAEAETGTVRVLGVREGSGLPAAGAVVGLWPDVAGGFWHAAVVLDADGRGTFAGIPPGHLALISGAPPDVGWEDGTLEPGATLELRLVIGQRTWFPVDLTGADGVSRVTSGDGAVSAASSDCRPYCGTYAQLGREWYPGRADALILSAGHEVASGPRTLSGLALTRRTFVPAGGRFVRLLDVIRNPTSSPITAGFYLEQDHGPMGGSWSVTATSSGDSSLDADDHYVVVSHQAEGNQSSDAPEVAVVLSGPGATLRHDPWTFETGEGWSWYGATWPSFTVLPGQSVILMSFVTQTPHGDVGEATARAEALIRLTDPDALVGVSPGERAAIVNFGPP